MGFKLSSLLPMKKTPLTLALLCEDQEVSWLLYDLRGAKPFGVGSGDWDSLLKQIDRERVQEVRVLATGRQVYYGLSEQADQTDEDLQGVIPFEPGSFQLRTIDVPGLEQADTSFKFFAVAGNSLISEISTKLSEAGLKLSSLEVPATVLARRSNSVIGKGGCMLQVHIGRLYTQFLLSYRGNPYLAREVGMGYSDFLSQYTSHLQCTEQRSKQELETLSVLGGGPIEPAVVTVLEQAARTTRGFRYPVELVSITGPGNMRGLESRLAMQFGAKPAFAEETGCASSLLMEVVRA